MGASRFAFLILLVFPVFAGNLTGVVLPLTAGVTWSAVDGRGGFPNNANGIDLYMAREELPVFDRHTQGRVVFHTVAGGEGPARNPSLRLFVEQNGQTRISEQLRNPESLVIDFDLDLSRLNAGEYELRAVLTDGPREMASASQPLRIVQADVSDSGRFAIRVPAVEVEQEQWPLTFGIPFPWGAVNSMDRIRILDPDGREVAYQGKITGRWSKEGSIRWMLVDILTHVWPEDQYFTVEYGPAVQRSQPRNQLRVDEREYLILVDTGKIRFEIPKRESSGIRRLWVSEEGRERLVLDTTSGSVAGPVMVDAGGTEFLGSRDSGMEVVVEEAGPLKAVIALTGYHLCENGHELGRYITRYTTWADSSFVQFDHTFILTHDAEEAQYRNIGYGLPMKSGAFAFGRPQGEDPLEGVVGDTGAYILQRDDQRYILNDGERREEEGRAPGWFTSGEEGAWMTGVIRDFWQMFPTEIEVQPEMVWFHFWPRHGEPPLRDPDTIGIEEVHNLWFAHEGEVMDLTVPERSLELFAQDSIAEDVGHARAANPAGLAVTHRILLDFHADPVTTRRAEGLQAVFQQEPTGICDPVWVTESGTFGWLLARDREQFPAVEEAIDLSFDIIRRYQEMDRDYGMFNFGDSHHSYEYGEDRVRLHRAWYQTHHGWNRWPWIQYARSGDEKFLQWGRWNSRNAADLAHVNYAPERFRNAPLPRRKTLGGITDYKGLVPWNRGDRFGYNSAADALLWHYYLTGDQRSLSTAMNHARGLLDDPDIRRDRAGSGRATSAIAAFWHTWDNDYLEFFERHIRQWLDEPPAHPQRILFAPSIERYIELTGSSRAKQMVVDWAEFILTDYPASTSYWYDLHRRMLLSYAYVISRDERYLQAAAKRVNQLVDYIYLDEDDPRSHGRMVAGPGNLYRGYFLQQAPYYLYAVALHGEEPENWLSGGVLIRSHTREELPMGTRNVFRAHLEAREVGDFQIETFLRGSGGAQRLGDTRAQEFGGWIETPDGERIDAELLPITRGLPMVWELEDVQPGRYELVIWSDANFYTAIPVTAGLDSWGEVYEANPNDELGTGHRYFFAMPSGARGVNFEFRGRGMPFAFAVFNPDGERVAADIFLDRLVDGSRALEVDRGNAPSEGWSFKMLSFRGGYLSDAWFRPDRNEPFYFSATPGKWFQP